jgi:GNAT superfamily N-acetyltransferase
MGAEYREEDMLDTWDEFLPLFRANFEAARDFPDLPFAISRNYYEALKASGHLRFYSMRVDGVAAGYAIFVLGISPQSGAVSAWHDALYIDPAHRLGHRGSNLLAFTEEQLRHLGATLIYQHTKAHADHGALLERRAYRKSETVYVKRLDQEVTNGRG